LIYAGERVKREQWRANFSEWFSDVVQRAEIMETRYPVKGLYVWMPHGLKLRNHVISILKRLLEETGHREVLFPLLIPENLFSKEAEHIRGFGGQVYWVTHGGHEKLDVRLALRPTSETSMYPMFTLWIQSHADLPLKVYQVVNVFRYETKMTKPLIRLREVTTFKEAHTAHGTAQEADRQIEEAIEIYKRFFDELCVPYVITKRPSWDTFAGATYSIAFDTLAPDGRTLQVGTVHNLGQNFSRVYDVSYEKVDGSYEHVYQTCYGISERAIAAVMMVHGDDIGLCLPPLVAPLQVIVVPIPYKDEKERVETVAEEVRKELKDKGLRVQADFRNLRPGNKYYYWERRGVPLRIEIGPTDVRENLVTVVRRDTGERMTIPRENLVQKVKELLDSISRNLKERAWGYFENHVRVTSSIEEAGEMIGRGGIVRLPWCGREECGKEVEEKTGSSVLGEEIDANPPRESACPACSGKAKSWLLVAKTY
jgi:prolyl-tRNA synthetase